MSDVRAIPKIDEPCAECGHHFDVHCLGEHGEPAQVRIECAVVDCECAYPWAFEPELAARVQDLGGTEPGTEAQDFFACVEQAGVENYAAGARAFYQRFVRKTVIRTVIWVVAATAIVHYYPDKTWVWYVVAAFLLIAIGFALFIRVMQRRAEAMAKRFGNGWASGTQGTEPL